MPFQKSKSKSPLQVNTKPPKKNSTSGFENAFANMSIMRFGLSAIPEVHSQNGSACGGVPTNKHVNTSQYTLGDNTRSYLEGRRPITSKAPNIARPIGTAGSGNNAGAVKHARTVSHSMSAAAARPTQAAWAFASKTGTALPSLLQSAHDAQMASRQSQIDSMEPSDRQAQSSWAQSIIQRSRCCPQKYGWNRAIGGYHCAGGHHYISDSLLADGNGGVLVLDDPNNVSLSYGPYYPDPSHIGQFLYCGPEPKPSRAPEYVNESGSGNFSSGTYKPNPSAAQAMTIGSQGRGPHSGGSQFGGSQIRSRSQSLNSQLAATQQALSRLATSRRASSQQAVLR
jgi:hypothetical protein